MNPSDVYREILAEVTDDLERRVLSILVDRAGEPVTRPDLVFRISGRYVQASELANDQDDRKIRAAIANLQAREYPIISSSGGAGYVLAADEAELDACIAELNGRVQTLRDKITNLRGSRKWIGRIRQYKDAPLAAQPTLFALPRIMP